MNTLHFRALLVSLSFAALAPSVAQAGDCPTCTSSADCSSTGSVGFCVVHDGPVGCGDLVQLCCPGQACGIGPDGRPSCEAAGTCTVVENLDAGMPGTDTGMSGTDTGGTDTGMSGTDTGSAGMDTGSSGTDTGASGMDTGTTPGTSGGCACRAGRGASPSMLLPLGVIALGLASIARRRR